MKSSTSFRRGHIKEAALHPSPKGEGFPAA